jgi:small subunit ribosomal protein S28e
MAKQQKGREGNEQQKSQQQGAGSRGSERLIEEGVVPAIVEATLARTGTRGEITQVRAKILQGKNRGKSIRRNVRGPVKKRDILMLRETEIEARRVTRKINKGSQA